MSTCFFVSDLHGRVERYRTLFERVAAERPAAVFLGGDLLPTGRSATWSGPVGDFGRAFLGPHLTELRTQLGSAYPRVFLILGNDDLRSYEAEFAAPPDGRWEYVHQRRATFADGDVYGYACVPPTPFLLKDWERYDVSRYVDPGGVSPEEGRRSVPADPHEVQYGTIQRDLEQLVGDQDLNRAIMLFHTPPHNTRLDRAGLDGRVIDGVPVDVHVGSIAVRRLIEQRQPRITLHGHIHESARLTGAWSEQIGRTWCFSAAHDGPELALVRFDPATPQAATRTLE